MCIITGKVQSVKGTKIFAMPGTEDKDRQLLVYKNEVASVAENLMILPVPFPESIKFEKIPKTIFNDCERSMNLVYANTIITLSATTRSVLPVLSIGSYRVSIVPSIHDFYRLDQNVFYLPPDLERMMENTYGGRPFGFICCILKAGVQNYEPLAYSHRMWKLGELFIPTLHYHPGEAGVDADWDHQVYTVRTTKEANRCDGYPREKNALRKLPHGFTVWPQEPVHCWMKEGPWHNIDLELPLIS